MPKIGLLLLRKEEINTESQLVVSPWEERKRKHSKHSPGKEHNLK